MIKNICILLVTLLVTSSAFSQEEEILKEVTRLAEQMFVSMNNRDYDVMIDMTHPKVFDLASKEEMKTLIKSTFEGNEEFSIEVPKLEPVYKLSEVYSIKENNLDYVFVSYDMSMKMTFHKQEFDEETKTLMINMMLSKGIDVQFISNSTFNMDMNDRITIILRDDSTSNKWVMLNYDPDSPLFDQIAPAILLEKAKEYNQNLLSQKAKN